MKRNILKKSLSEDLTWADFLKNDNPYAMQGAGGSFPNFMSYAQARSLYSTPERKSEVPNEYDKEEEAVCIPQQINQEIPKKDKKRHQHFKGKKGASSSSGKQHHSTQNSFCGIQGIASSLPQITAAGIPEK